MPSMFSRVEDMTFSSQLVSTDLVLKKQQSIGKARNLSANGKSDQQHYSLLLPFHCLHHC